METKITYNMHAKYIHRVIMITLKFAGVHNLKINISLIHSLISNCIYKKDNILNYKIQQQQQHICMDSQTILF